MEKVKLFMHLIRPQESLPLALITLFPAILFKKFEMSLVNLFLFACVISIYGFIINDIADLKLDRLNKETRNPLAKSEIKIYDTILISLLFLMLSFYFLLMLPKLFFALGSLVAILYYLYSFLLRAKAKPVLDLIFHGLVPTIFFIMSYVLFKQFDLNSFILSTVIFSLFATGELLQEIRDFRTDKTRIINTSLLIGQKASLKLSIYLIAFSLILGLYLISIQLLPNILLINVALSYFLLSPLIAALNKNRNSENLIYILSKRGAVLGILTLFLLLI